MSERKGDDAVRVPIEIKTEDLDELQRLIQELTEAEEAARTARALPSKGAAGPQTFGGQARRSGREAEAREGAGGIFGGGGGMQATPQTFRDRSGRQAMQRENQFSALQDQVKQMQEEQMEQTMGMMDQLIGMGTAYIPFLGGTKAASFLQHKVRQQMQKRAQQGAGGAWGGLTATAGGGFATAAAGGGKFSGLLAKVGTIAKVAGPIGAVIAAIVMGIVATKSFFDFMQAPGGFWDIRYRRHIQREMDPFLERREKQEINIGLRVVRVTTAPAVRGTGTQVFSTYEAVRKGIPIYNGEFEAFSKGLYI